MNDNTVEGKMYARLTIAAARAQRQQRQILLDAADVIRKQTEDIERLTQRNAMMQLQINSTVGSTGFNVIGN